MQSAPIGCREFDTQRRDSIVDRQRKKEREREETYSVKLMNSYGNVVELGIINTLHSQTHSTPHPRVPTALVKTFEAWASPCRRVKKKKVLSVWKQTEGYNHPGRTKCRALTDAARASFRGKHVWVRDIYEYSPRRTTSRHGTLSPFPSSANETFIHTRSWDMRLSVLSLTLSLSLSFAM